MGGRTSLSVPEDQPRDDIVNSWQVARDIYRLDGPIPRLFYEYKPDRLDQWRIERGNALGTTVTKMSK